MTADPSASTVPHGRTLLIDGRSGSGKTELARILAAETGSRLVHVEHFYPGWEGLAEGAQWLVDAVLAPRSRGEVVQLREWDWHHGGFRAGDTLEPGGDVIVEGCGAITRASAPFADLALWLEAPEPLRRERARLRDGDDDWWELWRQQEDALYAREQSAQLADAVLRMPGELDAARRLLRDRGLVGLDA